MIQVGGGEVEVGENEVFEAFGAELFVVAVFGLTESTVKTVWHLTEKRISKHQTVCQH
jgi:hypothetical protein